MTNRERRQSAEPPADADATARLRAGLSAEQLAALPTLEQFGWQLEFVRRPLFQTPVPVLRERDGSRAVVLEVDGSVTEATDLRLRGAPIAEGADPRAPA